MQVITIIIREISKLLMFAFLWGIPLWLSKDTGNYMYLWLLTLSAIFTMAMFSHYEDLERIDNKFNERQNEDL